MSAHCIWVKLTFKLQAIPAVWAPEGAKPRGVACPLLLNLPVRDSKCAMQSFQRLNLYFGE